MIAPTIATAPARRRANLFARFAREIRDGFRIVREHGFRALVRRKGKRVILAILAYCVVRDSILYPVIPCCVAKGVFSRTGAIAGQIRPGSHP